MKTTKTPVFIVSTGRAGSKMIAYALAKHSSLFAIHEPSPHLLTPGFMKWAGKLDRKQAINIIHKSRDRIVEQVPLNGLVYVESSHYCSHFISELAEIYDARFVHLFRRGDAFVKSGMALTWYEPWTLRQRMMAIPRRRLNKRFGSEWYDHRLAPPRHLKDRVSKLSWLWSELNEIILDQLQKLPSERYLSIPLESIGPSTLHQLGDYCAAASTSQRDLDQMFAVAERKINSSESKSNKIVEWHREDYERFMSIAGETMTRLGYYENH